MPSLLIIPLGLAIGVLVSAPIGPVNIICINRTLRRGFFAGVASGIGAVAADGLLAAIAGFGVTGIAERIAYHSHLVPFIGGVILVLFGLGVMLAPPPGMSSDLEMPKKASFWRVSAATFLITITNPGAILGMLGIFGSVVGTPIVPEGDFAAAGLLVVSVIGGAVLWWTGLAALVSRVRHRFSAHTFKTINLASGIVLMSFGALILVRLAALVLFDG